MPQERSDLNGPRHRRRRRFGTRRTQRPAAWVGQGIAWLVYDAARDCYHSYWLVGPAEDHIVEHPTAPSAADAVEWARLAPPGPGFVYRTTAPTGPEPTPPRAGFAGTWTAPSPTTTALAGHLSPETPPSLGIRPDGLTAVLTSQFDRRPSAPTPLSHVGDGEGPECFGFPCHPPRRAGHRIPLGRKTLQRLVFSRVVAGEVPTEECRPSRRVAPRSARQVGGSYGNSNYVDSLRRPERHLKFRLRLCESW